MAKTKSKVPWTEKFRPRFLDEVVLTRKQKTYLLSWWRCWKIWWILRDIWSKNHRNDWYAWTSEKSGKEWAKEHIDEWKTFFKKKFENWMGNIKNKVEKAGSYFYPPEAQQELFKASTKTQYTTELKEGSIEKIREWLQVTWQSFLKEKGFKDQSISVPPLPPYDPIFLVGPPGNGKTSSAQALAGEVGVSLSEMNASDDRSKKKVRENIGRVIRSGSLTGKSARKPSRLILFDEVDGMAGRKDRGGFSELLKQLKNTRYPVILTANNKDDRNVRKLMQRFYNTTVFFNRPRPYQIENLIERITERMDMEIPEKMREKLKGAQDLRTVVKALETYYRSGKIPQIRKDKMRGFKSALKKSFAFKQDGIEATMQKIQERIRSVEGKGLEDFLLWSWENGSKLVRREDLLPFYEELAYSDYIYQRSRRRRHWRGAYRASNYLAHAMTKWGEEKKNIWALRKLKLRFPESFKRYSSRKKFTSSGGKLRPIVEKFAKAQHISSKRARRELAILKLVGEKSPHTLGELMVGLRVDWAELDQLLDHYNLKQKEVKEGFEKAQKELRLRRGKEEEKREKEKRKKEEDEKEEEKNKGNQSLDDYL